MGKYTHRVVHVWWGNRELRSREVGLPSLGRVWPHSQTLTREDFQAGERPHSHPFPETRLWETVAWIHRTAFGSKACKRPTHLFPTELALASFLCQFYCTKTHLIQSLSTLPVYEEH